eukprot:CAMPEP_0196578916 /NCGR_PEP_ID=MMETSP1081-20130531/12929_1 /TAXON_ID=36882 /ORGANISM="Pyramimonas amylifera, Strain CCMP720" /LENGTH=243 /DNA_ID=CAMNT_0041898309 /DNA_START=205 /DNA_END=936 /DNA_ORIENTATION=-
MVKGLEVNLKGKTPKVGDVCKSRKRNVSVQSSTLQVFGHPGTRAPLVNWYLYELGTPFDILPPSDSRNPHPFGQVPALKDCGGVEVFESGAILLYLSDKYGGLDTPEKRAEYGKWIMWANATLDPILFKENENGKVIGTGMGGTPSNVIKLEKILEGKEFLVNDEFSVADVAVASYLLYVPQFFRDVDMGRWPNISAYMLRCADREAYIKAYGEDTAAYCRGMCENYLNGSMKKDMFKQVDWS